jgi:Na+/phosphate symporter
LQKEVINIKTNKQRIILHAVLPTVLTALFFINAALPVSVLGCVNRGLIAFMIALFSGLAALGTVIIALKRRLSGNPDSNWWIISTLILTIPVVALIILA